ncbi:MAG: GGDEF domain-containing protein [Halioglobus sp.]
MLNRLDRFLSGLPTTQIIVFALLLVGLLGAVDLLTGFELSFSVFYTVPIGIGAWYAGRRVGFLLCLISALTWLNMDYLSGHYYSHVTIPVWNAGVRFTFFVIIAGLLVRLHASLDSQAALARLDGLTGILNSRGFSEECDTLLKLACRHGRPLTLGYLDVDNFKAVNDNLGHSVGDLVLKTIAMELGKHLRDSDRCARIGGDEFAILLPETGLEGAQAYFQELAQRLCALSDGNDWPIGFSVGAAVFEPPALGIDEAIRCADAVMYKVKKAGKNNVLIERIIAGHPAPARRAPGS